MNPIAMGSVYMDKGEGIEYLESQIERMAKQKPAAYFLDVICRPEQIREAMILLGEFYELVADIMPLDKVYTAITCDDMIRPAAMALVIVTGSEDVQMRDINPGRAGR